MDQSADAARWDGRPLLLVSGPGPADGSARALHAALVARDPWVAVQLVLLPDDPPGVDTRGTGMLGAVPGIEQRLADWWQRTLR
jgi:hypothetical protein